MSKQKSGAGLFAAGLFTGIAAGAGVAFLLAPQTGEETRDILRAKVREASEQAGDLYEKGKTVIENARGTIEATVEDERETPERDVEHEQIHTITASKASGLSAAGGGDVGPHTDMHPAPTGAETRSGL